MSQGFELSLIQYLMVFLRETPSDGLDEFEKKFINFATFQPADSGPTRLYRDYFGEDTKIKILVTGEIELSEKNILVGLKMAFPEWEFELFPMNIQKLLLKDPNQLGTKEAGVVATIEPTIKMEKVQWGKPCIFDPSHKGTGLNFSSIHDDSFSSQPQVDTTDVPRLEEQLEKFKDIWTRDIYEDDPDPIDNTFTRNTEISEQNIQKSFDNEFKQNQINDPEPLDFYRSSDPVPDPLVRDNVTGADSEEILEQYGSKKPLWPFTESLEDEASTPRFTPEGFSNRVSFDDLDLDENSKQGEINLNRGVPDDNDLSPVDFEGANHEFEMLGEVQETPVDDLRAALVLNESEDDSGSIQHKFNEKSQEIISNLLKRIREFPTKKFATPLLVLGIALFALSYGMKILEPDYEAARKSAGIIDIYEWIIANDMLGEETDDVFEIWDETEESSQFWAWFERDWTPKISLFNSIRGGLRKVGGGLTIFGILMLTTTLLARNIAVDAEDESAQAYLSEDKRISLEFTIYNDPWPLVDKWGKECGLKVLEIDGPRRLYRKSGTRSHSPILCMIACPENQAQIEVWSTTRVPTILIPILSDLGIDALEAKNAVLPTEIKEQVNLLLMQLGHPPLA